MNSKPVELVAGVRGQAARIKQLERSNRKMQAAYTLNVGRQRLLKRQLRRTNKQLLKRNLKLKAQLSATMQVCRCQ
jgi:hypothetical protein